MKQIAYMARLSWRYLWSRPLAAALNLPADELTTLGGLYEQAWYSSAATTYADIEAARACLQALLQAGNERRR